jgi:nitrite reductase (NADH) small subunit
MRRVFACRESDLSPGERVVQELEELSIGVFNVNGRFFALHNRCPHRGGALCRGPVTGTTLPTDDSSYLYGREGEILRCAWHGWEFEIESGRSLVNPRVQAKTFPVEVEEGNVYVLLAS